MTVPEALKRSRETDEAFMRPGHAKWIRYLEGWTYRLTVEELLADDWQPIGQGRDA